MAKTIYRCPECGDKDRIEITGVATARLITNAIGEEVRYELGENGLLEFTDGDNAACEACGHSATVGDFTFEDTGQFDDDDEEPKGWRVEGRGDHFAIVDSNDIEVASVPYDDHRPGVEPLATAEGRTALLLAGAPKLLAACMIAFQACEAEVERRGPNDREYYGATAMTPVVEILAKAIARAKGQA